MNNHYVLFDSENQVVGFARASCQYPIPHSKHDFKTSTDHVLEPFNSDSKSMKGNGKKKNMINSIINNNINSSNSGTSSSSSSSSSGNNSSRSSENNISKQPFLPKKIKNKSLLFNLRKNVTRLRRKSMKILH